MRALVGVERSHRASFLRNRISGEGLTCCLCPLSQTPLTDPLTQSLSPSMLRDSSLSADSSVCRSDGSMSSSKGAHPPIAASCLDALLNLCGSAGSRSTPALGRRYSAGTADDLMDSPVSFPSGTPLGTPHHTMPSTPQRTPRMPESPKRGVRLERTDSLLQSKVLYTSPAALNHNDIAPQFNFDGHFKDWHKVGIGSFGEVYKAQSVQTGKWYAIKRSRKAFNGRWERERYLQEIHTVCSLGEHANIVKYYRAWQENQHFYLQLELCEGGNLQNLLDFQEERVSAETMRQFWVQMSSGLAHIHAHDMLHLDLKPENIFIVGDAKVGRTLKIGDFGTAVTLGQWDDEDGDPMYLAPELLRGEAGPPADVC